MLAHALEYVLDANKNWLTTMKRRIATRCLTLQQQVMDITLAGHPNKNIAAELGTNQRKVENDRASIMNSTRSKSIPALARITLAANQRTLAKTASRSTATHKN